MAKGNPNPSPETRFEPGNKANIAAGGVAAAVRDLAHGLPLRGNLAAIQHRYAEQIATHSGRVDAQRWLAGAFLAVVEGLLAVVQGAIEEDNVDKAVSYIRNFGTFGTKAGAELARLEELDVIRADSALDYAELVKQLEAER